MSYFRDFRNRLPSPMRFLAALSSSKMLDRRHTKKVRALSLFIRPSQRWSKSVASIRGATTVLVWSGAYPVARYLRHHSILWPSREAFVLVFEPPSGSRLVSRSPAFQKKAVGCDCTRVPEHWRLNASRDHQSTKCRVLPARASEKFKRVDDLVPYILIPLLLG